MTKLIMANVEIRPLRNDEIDGAIHALHGLKTNHPPEFEFHLERKVDSVNYVIRGLSAMKEQMRHPIISYVKDTFLLRPRFSAHGIFIDGKLSAVSTGCHRIHDRPVYTDLFNVKLGEVDNENMKKLIVGKWEFAKLNGFRVITGMIGLGKFSKPDVRRVQGGIKVPKLLENAAMQAGFKVTHYNPETREFILMVPSEKPDNWVFV